MNLVIESVTKKYATFSGRARRKEFWLFILFFYVGAFALMLIDIFLGTVDYETGVGLLSTIFSLGLLLPCLAIYIRRLHDTDRSGWWFLIAFIPLLGVIVLMIFCILRGTAGPNRFGPDPITGEAMEHGVTGSETA